MSWSQANIIQSDKLGEYLLLTSSVLKINTLVRAWTFFIEWMVLFVFIGFAVVRRGRHFSEKLRLSAGLSELKVAS